MSPSLVMDHPPVTLRGLRLLVGSSVRVRTISRTLRGTLLSCVRGSLWLVVDDADVIVRRDEIVSVSPS